MSVRNPSVATRSTATVRACADRTALQWPGLGINYSASNSGDISRDIPILARYFTRIRPQYPLYSADSSLQQLICTAAKTAGLYVVWGVTTPNPCDAGTWAAFKTAVVSMAATATSLGVDQFSLGNECELHADGTTLTAGTVRSDIRALALAVKAVFGGIVSYEADQNQSAAWVSEGIGALDKLGLNVYSNAATHAARLAAIGTGRTYVSEFNNQSGYFTANNEAVFTNNVMERLHTIRTGGIQTAYFYNWQYDTAYQWALHLPNGAYRQVFYPLVGVRA
ncbi:MAG TPA: hypothetical protein VLI54_00050 [Bacillota bacterium]|nr:hypothetical protein [Bacillota bacterium]